MLSLLLFAGIKHFLLPILYQDQTFPDSLAASNSLIGLNHSFTEDSETTVKSSQRAVVNKAVCLSYQINNCSHKRLVVANEARLTKNLTIVKKTTVNIKKTFGFGIK